MYTPAHSHTALVGVSSCRPAQLSLQPLELLFLRRLKEGSYSYQPFPLPHTAMLAYVY